MAKVPVWLQAKSKATPKKGEHMMPDGTIMKNSDMPMYQSKAKKKGK